MVVVEPLVLEVLEETEVYLEEAEEVEDLVQLQTEETEVPEVEAKFKYGPYVVRELLTLLKHTLQMKLTLV